jgi:hypothetical protein
METSKPPTSCLHAAATPVQLLRMLCPPPKRPGAQGAVGRGEPATAPCQTQGGLQQLQRRQRRRQQGREEGKAVAAGAAACWPKWGILGSVWRWTRRQLMSATCMG